MDELLPIRPWAGVIYSWLFRYTQHTAGFTENNKALSWSYLLLTVQVHTTTHCRFYREQLGPELELSTLDCSGPHNNTLQGLQKTIRPWAGVIYSWLFRYTQQHTVGFTENNWALSWSYLLLTVQVHTTTHCRVYREQLGPELELSTLDCSSTHNNTLQGLQRTIGPCTS